MSQQHKRRNYFIKKDLQGKHVFTYFAFVIIGSILFSVIFSLFAANTLTISYDNYDLKLGATPLILFEKILTAEWLFILLGGILIVIASLFLSHRVAGPIFVFERTLDSMTKGDISKTIHLRKKDEGKELAVKINSFNIVLSSHIGEMRKLADEMETSLAQLQEESSSDQINNLLSSTKQLRDILSSFTIQEK